MEEAYLLLLLFLLFFLLYGYLVMVLQLDDTDDKWHEL
jgi:hypothetical protein